MTSALMPTYPRADIAFDKGEGAYLYAEDGRRYLDFAAGIAVTALGHCHPHLVAALAGQAGKLWHCSNMYSIPGQERLAQRLAAASFADAVFFTNSGSEAVECGLKLVRKYFDDKGEGERYRVVTCDGAFHGRTLAAVAAGGQEKHLKGFDPVVDGFDSIAFGNLNETRAAIGPETAAILVEPIQGESGIRTPPEGYLEGLRQVADEFGLLLFFDEVQCGMGRTGKLFAHEWDGVAPDILATAKGIGGGFPVGACMATNEVSQALGPGSHGSTYGGNPLAMAVGNAVLDMMLEDGFFERVAEIAGLLRQKLEALAKDHPGVVSQVRGQGLMLGLKCVVDNKDFRARLAGNGLLVVNADDNVVRLLPPLIIGQDHVDEALDMLEKTCAEMETEGG